jgi:hypothetical protein
VTTQPILDWFASLPQWVQGASAVAGILGILPLVWNGLRLVYTAGRALLDILAGLNRRTALHRAEALAKEFLNARDLWQNPARMAPVVGSLVLSAIGRIFEYMAIFIGVAFIVYARDPQIFHLQAFYFGALAIIGVFIIMTKYGATATFLDVLGNPPQYEKKLLDAIQRLLRKAGLDGFAIEVWLVERGVKHPPEVGLPPRVPADSLLG